MAQGTNASNYYDIDPSWGAPTLAYRAAYMAKGGYPPTQQELWAIDAGFKSGLLPADAVPVAVIPGKDTSGTIWYAIASATAILAYVANGEYITDKPDGWTATGSGSGGSGTDGTDGWSPILAIATDGARRVQQVINWTGGTGAKPATGQYVGANGLVSDIAQAVNIKGEPGSGGSTISINDTAFVSATGNDSNAAVGSLVSPFKTIAAALLALGALGGVIDLGIGTFSAPPTDQMRSNVWFRGSMRPTTNMGVMTVNGSGALTISSPTKLIGGTIIQGSMLFTGKTNLQFTNLGVDCGADWVGAGNAPGDCLSINADITGNDSVPPYNLMQNVSIVSCSFLNYQSTTPYHCLVVQGCYEPYLSNVYTYFGFAGIVIKSVGGTATGIFTHGHGIYGIIIKNNSYAYCRDIVLSDFQCSSIQPNDGAGLAFSTDEMPAGSPNMSGITIANGNIRGTKTGITAEANPDFQFCIMSNLNISNVQGDGIDLSGTFAVSKLTNVIVDKAGGTCIKIGATSDTAFVTVDNCSATSGANGFVLSASGSGKIYARNNNALANANNDFSYSGNVFGNGNAGTTISGTITPLS